MKVFRVRFEEVAQYYIDIPAKTKEEAEQIFQTSELEMEQHIESDFQIISTQEVKGHGKKA